MTIFGIPEIKQWQLLYLLYLLISRQSLQQVVGESWTVVCKSNEVRTHPSHNAQK